MKLLIDDFHVQKDISLEECSVKVLTEEKSGAKKYYIEGIFAQAEQPNRNGRIYPRGVMENALKLYQPTIDAKRALGEMSHPNHPHVNLERASHLIESLTWDGNNVIGRAKILTEMPMGKIAKGLIDEGIQLGVSTRGLGSLKETNGVKVVQDDFTLNTVDLVSDPSAIGAWVNAVMEGAEWVNQNGNWVMVENIKKTISKSTIKQISENQAKWFAHFLSNLK